MPPSEPKPASASPSSPREHPPEKPPHPHRLPFAGLLPLAILKLLSEKPMHGYQIAEELAKRIGHKIPKSLIYVTLRRLEERGLVSSEWEIQESGPARRVYHITEEGLKFLDRRVEALRIFKKLIEMILGCGI